MVEDPGSFWTDIQRYEDMLVADPRSHCFAPLSDLYRRLGLLDDAISVASKGCEMHPDYPGGFLALGSACYEKGLAAEARQALERVVALTPEDHRARKLLGRLYVDAGEAVLARQVLEQVLLQNPDDLESALLLRSLALTGETTRLEEEELLEEAEVIEDLTELFDEPQVADISEPFRAAEPSEVSQESPGALTQSATAAAYGKDASSGAWEDADNLWAVEAQEEAREPASASCEAFRAVEGPADSGAFEYTGAFEDSEEAFEDSEETFEDSASPATIDESPGRQPARDPLTTATLAELYVSQGYIDKALTIYKELLLADPANHACRLRCAELSEMLHLQQAAQKLATPATRPQAAPAQKETAPSLELDVEAELGGWLENIRRRKDGL